ncbi:hypothetical protein TD95_003947 [Thielaviopsis punctulata]|uniref:MARVEL domain-containing protein n=1 Tax=Thielaviopsis punctulata TaxID=72032 RepID=A0A0F4ZDK5_9PEZI|nr:hypothetical protein TD95_003947 [Thielaviopsis punctulata]
MGAPGWINLGARIWQFVWTLIATALLGNVIASNIDGSSSGSTTLNYSMWALVLCWIACLYGLGAAFVPAMAIPIVLVVLDSLATLFMFIDAIVLSARIKAVDCSRLVRDKLPHNYIAWGSNNDEKRCREIQASAVFLWFLFFSFVLTLTFAVIDAKRRGLRGKGGAGGPAMTQVRF